LTLVIQVPLSGYYKTGLPEDEGGTKPLFQWQFLYNAHRCRGGRPTIIVYVPSLQERRPQPISNSSKFPICLPNELEEQHDAVNFVHKRPVSSVHPTSLVGVRLDGASASPKESLLGSERLPPTAAGTIALSLPLVEGVGEPELAVVFIPFGSGTEDLDGVLGAAGIALVGCSGAVREI